MVVRSPHPNVDIPEVPLAAHVLQRARDLAGKPALIDGPSGRTLTYGQLADAVGAAARGLAAHGLRKGDVFGMISPNLPEFAVAFLAVASLGAVVTTVNSLATEGEIATQLADSGARALLTVPPFMDRAAPAARRAGVEDVYVFGEAEGATPFASLLSEQGDPPDVEIDPAADLVALPYSSGTTGLSKGVMLTHRNLVANIVQAAEAGQRIGEDDTLIGILPFFHIYGLTVVMNLALSKGATIVTLPRFELEPFLQLMQDHGVTRGYLVPPIVLALAKHPLVDRFDLSKLQMILSGAAPLDESLARACSKRLGCRVVQGYGLTETSPVTHLVPDWADLPAGSIGPPVPNTECLVIDWATGEEKGPNEDGEILVRGPQVMRGYLNNPEATAATIDEDGWLHTGDIGHADEQGNFYIVDRLKELIKYKGYQVAPALLEAVLLSHQAIADAAVVPSADDEAGEVPKAFVVLKGEATPEELMAYVGERVAPYERIRRVEFIDEIPRSLSGKILRRVLVERERAGS